MAEPLDADAGSDLRSRATTSVLLVASRNIIVRGVGLVGVVILARLLEPADFGILALGLAVTAIGRILADGGLGAQLIQRREPPERADLGAMFGFQLVTSIFVAAVALLVCVLLGGDARVIGIMALSLPFAALRAPTSICLQRELRYGPLAWVEIAETLLYNVLAVSLVVAGFDLWGIAVAVVCQSAFGSVLLIVRNSTGWTRPTLSMSHLRPLLAFGVAYQSVSLVATGRDHALSVLLTMVGGTTLLGLWSLAYRLIQSVLALLQAVWRVSFSAMARLIDAGEDEEFLVGKMFGFASIAVGLLVVVIGGTAPALVPALFGETWNDSIPALAWGCGALAVSGPISTAVTGFLHAKGEARQVLVIVTRQTIVWLVVAGMLAPSLGPEGVGIAMFVAALVLATSLVLAARRHVRIQVLQVMAPNLLAVGVAGAAAWAGSTSFDEAWFGLAAGLAVGIVTYLLLVALLRRDDLVALQRTLRRATRTTVSGMSLGRRRRRGSQQSHAEQS